MKKHKYLIMSLVISLLMTTTFSGCDVINQIAVKTKLKNEQFEYIKQNRVDKIIIQNVRDSGFRFIVNDSQAINEIYDVLSKGKEVSEKTSLDPDYVFEISIGEEVKKYQYVVGSNERGKGNFYDEDKAFSVSKNLENTIMQNLSFIRKPRNFQYIYYESILQTIKLKKDSFNNDNKVGIDIVGDADCLKYMFSIDLQEFEDKLNDDLPSSGLVNNNYDEFDTIIKVKNRGYSSTLFKTQITIDNKIDKTFETYYISAEYNFKDWDINISEPNEKPKDW